ncbi:hypothetical protein AAFF_G00065160 [Aldrovandia affinis]|uniref:RecQ-mediated genome instability protein 1 n=1 Tax=Aldrovandia affinis TaxID=143900 RepID=A0AAD7T407_9TELE|nr:hypothetical protein AAFF_G00065160 [Aldrovandia affinis]
MSGQGVAQRAREWLSSTWHVQVPYAWLEACVSWVVQEGAGASVRQAHVNQQVLEQWLLTDLRSLAHPVLPVQLGQALKTELSGCFCLQVDSLLDISRPAYSQLQQWRGADCGNEQVSTVTQVSQRPWEAAPTRVLMLQLTDGVQDLQALEYQPIPALSASLPPGTKLLLQGTAACRLGVLLLRPGNVRVLGGEVEELRAANSQGRVLCEVLGLPEDGPQEAEPRLRDEGLSDEELLASLEAVVADSGYGSRSEVSDGSYRGAERPRSVVNASPATDGPVTAGDLDEDFEDIPLDELDSVIFQEEPDPAQGGGHTPLEEAGLGGQVGQVRFGAPGHGKVQQSVGPVLLWGRTGALGPSPTCVPCGGTAQARSREVQVKAFIVTLLGSLQSSSGAWQVSATISDGSGYLDVRLSDGVLAGLIQFSVAESRAMRKDPERRPAVLAGLERCQRELVDMCCLMTLRYDPTNETGEVLRAQEVTADTCRDLESRVHSRAH